MLVMTAKVDKKKIVIGLAVVVVVIAALIMLFSGGKETTPTAAPSVSTNDGRVQFLKGFGWEVNASPVESGQVRIPKDQTEVFSRYNALQKSQGYDLNQFAGKSVMRYVYKITNYPGATEPVYATVLVYKNQIIGGDVTNTAAKGVIQGFTMAKHQPTTPPAATAPATQPTAPQTTVPQTTKPSST